MADNQISIPLDQVNVQLFCGNQNSNITTLGIFFPQLKLVARGTILKAYGSLPELEEFREKVSRMLNYISIYNTFDETVIDQIVHTEDNIDMKLEKDKFILHGIGGKGIKPRTRNQKALVDSVYNNDIVFAIGPAGTGKTYISLALAVKALKDRTIRRIILTRPAVEAGEHLGFLPGDLQEKLDPYMQPLYDALEEMIPNIKLNSLIEKKVIQIAPIAFMRGRTLNDAFVILDEAQNTTQKQMKMFLTRMGMSSKFIITGDLGQIDLPVQSKSGLRHASDLFKNTQGIAIVKLDRTDVIRHPLVKKIIKAYQKSDDSESDL